MNKYEKIVICAVFLTLILAPGFAYIFNQPKANESILAGLARWQSIMSEPINK